MDRWNLNRDTPFLVLVLVEGQLAAVVFKPFIVGIGVGKADTEESVRKKITETNKATARLLDNMVVLITMMMRGEVR